MERTIKFTFRCVSKSNIKTKTPKIKYYGVEEKTVENKCTDISWSVI